MTRRRVFSSLAAAAAPLASAQEAPRQGFFELRYYRMRNGKSSPARRTGDFVSRSYVPAAKRAGIGPIGVFTVSIGPEQPSLLVLSAYPSLAAMEASLEKLAADAEYQKGLAEFSANPDLAYVRTESTLLRCFPSVPQIEPGTPAQGRGSRIFELRTYESDNEATLQRKIKMFGDGEIAVFRKSGITPVFFGEALVGPNLPRLTYMVAYENMDARDKAWAAFGKDPDWQKLRTQPGLSDAEIVSSISTTYLRPAAGSDIR